MQKYFASQQPDEEVVMVIRRHWIVLLLPLITGGLIYLIGLSIIFILPRYMPALFQGIAYNIMVPVMSLFFLYNTLYIFIEWLMYYLHVGIITTEHLVDIGQKNLFSRKIAELGLENIQDIAASQMGLLQTFYNFGDVVIQTAGELPNFTLEKAPNPYDVSQKIMELKEEFIKNRYGSNTGRAPYEV